MESRLIRITLAPRLPPASGGEGAPFYAAELDSSQWPVVSLLRVRQAPLPAGVPGIRVTLLESPDGTHWKELPAGPEPEDGGEGFGERTLPGSGEAPEEDPPR